MNSLLKEMIQKQRKVIQPHEIPIFDDSLFVMYPNSASCNENAELVTLIMRSKGLPVTISVFFFEKNINNEESNIYPNLKPHPPNLLNDPIMISFFLNIDYLCRLKNY